MNRGDCKRFRTLDNWTRLNKDEEMENKRRGLHDNDILAKMIKYAASKDSTIIDEWEGEGY